MITNSAVARGGSPQRRLSIRRRPFITNSVATTVVMVDFAVEK